MGHLELTDLDLWENRGLLEREDLQECLESQDLLIIQELLGALEVQEHQSQDPRESEPPDLQAAQ